MPGSWISTSAIRLHLALECHVRHPLHLVLLDSREVDVAVLHHADVVGDVLLVHRRGLPVGRKTVRCGGIDQTPHPFGASRALFTPLTNSRYCSAVSRPASWSTAHASSIASRR